MIKGKILVDSWRQSWWLTQATLGMNQSKLIRSFETVDKAQKWLMDCNGQKKELDGCIVSEKDIKNHFFETVQLLVDLQQFGIGAIALVDTIHPGRETQRLINEGLITQINRR